MTKDTFAQISRAAASHFGQFTDFQAAAAGTLPMCVSLEPSWNSTGNSWHPNYDVALGEQLTHDEYGRCGRGRAGRAPLLVITYDEHGGRFGHVLAGSTIPVAPGPAPATAGNVSHPESIHAELAGRRFPAGPSPGTRPA